MVWENVPGVLSSNGGRDFGAILGGMVELGFGFAYRVLDAQYFGIPQRRRRVFVVGCLGSWQRAAAVLFERHSLQGNLAPRREPRQGIAGGVEIGPAGGRLTDLAPTLDARCKDGPIRNQLGVSVLAEAYGGNNTSGPIEVSTALNAKSTMRGDFETETFITELADPLTAREQSTYTHEGRGNFRTRNVVAFSAKDHGQDASEEVSPTLRGGNADGSHANGGCMPAVAINENQQGAVWESDTTQALNKGGGKPGQGYAAVRCAATVRRLTPRECERLQGFPDNFTLVPYRGKPAADGPRYKALGNSMAVPVMRWIGERIAMVDALP